MQGENLNVGSMVHVPLLVSLGLVILAKWKARVNLVVLDTGERDDRLLSTERRGNHF